MNATSTRSACSARTAAIVALALAELGTTSAATPPAEWNFNVRLDGKPIGTHRYVLNRARDGRLALSSEAQFEVTLLGVPLNRYQHRVSERWEDGCVASIEARTDDNGRLTEVRGQAQGGRFDLEVRNEGSVAPVSAAPAGCVMSFAYWNPALASHHREPGGVEQQEGQRRRDERNGEIAKRRPS